VFITGSVTKPGMYPLNDGLTVLQLIAVSGGVLEYADKKHITVLRADGSRHSFNYKANLNGEKTIDNIALKPGDTVAVP
jgi:polysaccharide biosynthesis/export protein